MLSNHKQSLVILKMKTSLESHQSEERNKYTDMNNRIYRFRVEHTVVDKKKFVFFFCCTAVLQDVVREITVKTPFKQLVKLLGVNVYKTLILRLYGIITFWRCVTTHMFSLYTSRQRKMALRVIIKSTQKVSPLFYTPVYLPRVVYY